MNIPAQSQPLAPESQSHPGLQSLARRLAQPVSAGVDGCRSLPEEAGQSLLAGLLQEIHESILPRIIRVMADSGREFDLHVANRRLFDIQTGGAGKRDKAIRSGDAEFALVCLNRLLDGAKRAEIRVARRAGDPSRNDRGCHALALASKGSVVLFRAITPDPVPALFTALKRAMTAWIKLDRAGHGGEHGGENIWAQRLVGLSHDGLAEIEAQLVQSLTSPDQPGCVMLNFAGAGGRILLYARSDAEGFAAILPGAKLLEIQAVWKSLSG